MIFDKEKPFMKNKHIYLLSLIFLVIFIFNPFGTNIFELPKIHFLATFLSITAISLVIYFLKKGEITFRYNKTVFILLSLWLLSLILSTIFSIAPDLSFWGSYMRMQGLFSHLIYLAFFIIFLNLLKTEKEQKIILKVLVAFASIVAIHAILEQCGLLAFSKQALIEQEFYGRSFSTFGHPNYMGQFLIFPIWIGAYFITTTKKRKQNLPVILTILLIIGLLLTKNRASILGMIIATILLILFVSKIKIIYKYLISAGLIAGFTSFILFFAPTFRSFYSRLYIWKGSITAFTENPIIGSGLETFQIVFQKFFPEELITLEKASTIADRAHNEFLDILVMQGIFGFVIFLTILTGIFYIIFKNKNKLRKNNLLLFLVFAFISILISNFFGFSVTVHYLTLTLILAIIVNQTLKFREIKLKKGILTFFISGIIVAVSLLCILNSAKKIYADYKLLSGINYLYSQEIQKGLLAIDKAATVNPNQAEIFYKYSDIM
ncbi:hypothetical protein GF366_00805, partial [Candidatus Peregrinibacteria bacterium]|nr:hypothetical protein [Candidatus Peregrinibacteria bacterium]